VYEVEEAVKERPRKSVSRSLRMEVELTGQIFVQEYNFSPDLPARRTALQPSPRLQSACHDCPKEQLRDRNADDPRLFA
jgi:hypothetical protein